MIRFFCVAAAVLFTLPVFAAESLDQAVSQVAEKYIGSQDVAGEPIRVAVTPFQQSDRQETQFTNLLMITLTGKLVEKSNGTFKMVERAQMKTPLNELGLSGINIIDPNTTKELGRFLGVDALVIGEITPLSDRVQIDSRMINVETIEIMETARVWVPLTPSVQRQLDTRAIIDIPNGGNDRPDPRNGIWSGIGKCGEVSFGVAISVVAGSDNTVSAMQTYYPLRARSDLKAGVLSMEGTIDRASGDLSLVPRDWLFQPEGHQGLGFQGKVDFDREEIVGQYTQEGCDSIQLRRTR